MNTPYQQSQTNQSETNVSTVYICGSKFHFSYIQIDCGNEQEIRPRDNIVCKECNGRIFYKKRMKKASQYEAR